MEREIRREAKKAVVQRRVSRWDGMVVLEAAMDKFRKYERCRCGRRGIGARRRVEWKQGIVSLGIILTLINSVPDPKGG